MWLNHCSDCKFPFVAMYRLNVCPLCRQKEGYNVQKILCEGECAFLSINRTAIVKRNGLNLCTDCADDFSPAPNDVTIWNEPIVLTDQLMHSLTANYLVSNLDN